MIIALLLVFTVFWCDILIFNKKRVIGSPIQLFCLSIFVVYIFPQVVANSDLLSEYSAYAHLADYYKDTLVDSVNTFAIFFLALWILITAFKIGANHKFNVVKFEFTSNQVIISLVLCTFAKYLYLGLGLGMNPTEVINRFLHPREYTYIVQGTGVVNYLHVACSQVVVFIATNFLLWAKTEKLTKRIILYLIALLITIGGGGKQNFIWFVFYFITIYQKGLPALSIGRLFIRCAVSAVIISFVFAIAFYVVRRDGESEGMNFLQILTSYQNEAFFSAQVLYDFSWTPEYLWVGIHDTLVAVIPRNIWEAKPLAGYYNTYWRDIYEPGTEVFHTSTYGFLSEAHMMFGILGIYIYAIIWAFLLKLITNVYACTTSSYSFYIVDVIALNIYFFIRDGFLGFTFWYVFALCAIGTFILYFLKKT